MNNMPISQLAITEDGVTTYYANLCPATYQLRLWLGKILDMVVMRADTINIVQVPGLDLKINRHNVTSITITSSNQ